VCLSVWWQAAAAGEGGQAAWLETCLLRLGPGPCSENAVHLVMDGISGVINQSEPLLRAVTESAVATIDTAADAVKMVLDGAQDLLISLLPKPLALA
jgi:hypothetical protein